MGKAFHRRVSDKNRLAVFTWHFLQMRFASLLTVSCWRTPDAAIRITSKLGCIFRRKFKPQLLDTTVVTTHPYATHKQQDIRLGKQSALNTEHWKILFPLRSLAPWDIPRNNTPTWSAAFAPSALSVSQAMFPCCFHPSLRTLTLPACAKTWSAARSTDRIILHQAAETWAHTQHHPLPWQRSKTQGSCLSYYR